MNLGFLALALPAASMLTSVAPVLPDGQIRPSSVNENIRKLRESFKVEAANLTHSGRSKYFVLEPGHKFELSNGLVKRRYHVLKPTERIDGVETRPIEVREVQAGRVVQVSRRFFALDKRTKDVYCFGGETEPYQDGKSMGISLKWRAGVDGARVGLEMPGQAQIGMYFRIDNAPGVAVSEGRVKSLTDSTTAAGRKFTDVLRIEVTNPSDPSQKRQLLFGQWTGIIRDGDLVRQQHVPE